MAGLRQGIAPAAPAGPQRSGGRCRPEFLGSARNGRSPGEETSGQPLQQGARGAAVPCQPKPLTRPWVSAVLAVARKEIWQGSVGAFNVRLTHPARETDLVGLPNQDATICRQAVNEMHRRAGFLWLPVTGRLAQTAGRRRQAPSGAHPAPPRSARLFAGGDWNPTSSGQVRAHPTTQMTQALKPRPALPGGALWRSWCGQGRAAQSRPPLPHAARRCSSTSSSASAVSVSPPSATSAAPAAAGSGSSGTSGSASHAARLAAATVATPPRWV